MRVSPLRLSDIAHVAPAFSARNPRQYSNSPHINNLQRCEIHRSWHRPCTIHKQRRVLDWHDTNRLKESRESVQRWVKFFGWLGFLLATQFASAQVQIGDNTHMNAGGLFSVGYAGDYGDQIQSSHGLQFGASGNLSGYYYNPNFLNFNVTPYYNQSTADSSFQSLTNASGVAATANFFTGSRFPGSVTYRYDYNSTGNFGLPNTPNFTTQGTGQGFGVTWSALLPDWPTLTVGYQQGSGSGTLYGTNQESSSDQKLFNVHSSYHY